MGRITGIGPQVIFLSLSSQVRPDRFDRERMGSSGDDSSPRNDPKVTIRRFARAATGKSRQLDPRNPWWDVSLSSAFPSLQIMGLFHWPFLSSFPLGFLQWTIPQLCGRVVDVLGCVVHGPCREHCLSLISSMGDSYIPPTRRVLEEESVIPCQCLSIASLYRRRLADTCRGPLLIPRSGSG